LQVGVVLLTITENSGIANTQTISAAFLASVAESIANGDSATIRQNAVCSIVENLLSGDSKCCNWMVFN
jgi:hypothetical protein